MKKYRANKCKYDFQQNKTTGSFGKSIYTGKTTLNEAKENERNLLKMQQNLIINLEQKTKNVRKIRNTFSNVTALYKG